MPFGIWGTARQGWQLARAWQGGFVPMPNYAAQGTMALMRHVASKQHPEALGNTESWDVLLHNTDVAAHTLDLGAVGNQSEKLLSTDATPTSS